jgi:hypothetical protein
MIEITKKNMIELTKNPKEEEKEKEKPKSFGKKLFDNVIKAPIKVIDKVLIKTPINVVDKVVI